MRYAVLTIVAVALVLSGLPAIPSAQAQSCQFVLGFATLHSMIPNIVGDCLENEHHNPDNGDGLQMTTHGLLVWRKADNFTAFTDGFRTWVNGPFGLQERLNSQGFFWEFNPEGLTIVPTPVPGQRCHTAGLSLTMESVEAGAGNRFATLRFTNRTGVSCTFFGFPGGQMLDAQSNPLPTNVVRGRGFFPSASTPMTVVVPAGGSAIFTMHWEVIPVGNEVSCPASAQLAVTPPDEFDPIIIPAQIQACNGGELDVSVLQAGS